MAARILAGRIRAPGRADDRHAGVVGGVEGVRPPRLLGRPRRAAGAMITNPGCGACAGGPPRAARARRALHLVGEPQLPGPHGQPGRRGLPGVTGDRRGVGRRGSHRRSPAVPRGVRWLSRHARAAGPGVVVRQRHQHRPDHAGRHPVGPREGRRRPQGGDHAEPSRAGPSATSRPVTSIVAGTNFGCGSSRPAPRVLRDELGAVVRRRRVVLPAVPAQRRQHRLPGPDLPRHHGVRRRGRRARGPLRQRPGAQRDPGRPSCTASRTHPTARPDSCCGWAACARSSSSGWRTTPRSAAGAEPVGPIRR